MSGQYGEPDWANATGGSPTPVADAGAAGASSGWATTGAPSASSGWATPGGGNAGGAATNANAAGTSNVTR